MLDARQSAVFQHLQRDAGTATPYEPRSSERRMPSPPRSGRSLHCRENHRTTSARQLISSWSIFLLVLVLFVAICYAAADEQYDGQSSSGRRGTRSLRDNDAIRAQGVRSLGALSPYPPLKPPCSNRDLRPQIPLAKCRAKFAISVTNCNLLIRRCLCQHGIRMKNVMRGCPGTWGNGVSSWQRLIRPKNSLSHL